MEFSNTHVTVDLDAILDNFKAICQKAGAPVMAVVKADAYGHGAVTVARLLEDLCAFFGVSSLPEALELKEAGLKKPILILGHTPQRAYEAVVKNQIRVGICSEEEAQALSREAQRQKTAAYVHIQVDTGMSRLGFQVCPEAAEQCARIAKLPNLTVEGLYSHFATADSEDLSDTQAQIQRFAAFEEMLRKLGLEIPVRHLDNSAGIMDFGCNCNLVRGGIAIYGIYPSQEVDKSQLALRPAMSWHTEVSHVKLLEEGRKISYGGTYTTEKPTMVATIPVGYADGYRRSMSGKFYVLIRGKKAPILGRICMDQMMVDVTDIPGVEAGDPVVLMGANGEESITVEQLSEAANSFPYEQVCNISRRVARVYIRDGKEVGSIDYLR